MEGPRFKIEGLDDDEDDKTESYELDSASEKPRKPLSLEGLFVKKEEIEEDEDKHSLENLFVSKPEKTEDTEPEVGAETDKAADSETLADETIEQESNELETLDSEEETAVAEELLEEESQNLQAELAGAETDDQEAEVIGAATFVETLKDKIDQAGEVTDEVIDQAADEAIAELGLEDTHTEAEESPEEEPAATEAIEDTLPEPETNEPDAPEDPIVPPTVPPVVPPVPPTSVSPPTGPPIPPMPPIGGGLPPFGPNGPGFNPNAMSGTQPEAQSQTHEASHSHVPYVVAGGILGYLLGRRRGRIKTEEKLMPVQKKLETEVKELKSKITEREDKVRRLIRDQHEKTPIDKEKAVAKLNERSENRQKKERFKEQRSETLTRPQQPEARAAKPFEQLQFVELLAIAKEIEFAGVDLKTMYEQGRVDMVGLKRIVKEYMQGGNFETEIQRNLTPEKVSYQPETMTKPDQPEPQLTPAVVPGSTDSFQQFNKMAEQQLGGQSVPQVGGYNQTKQVEQKDSLMKKPAVLVGSIAVVVFLAIGFALLLLSIL